MLKPGDVLADGRVVRWTISYESGYEWLVVRVGLTDGSSFVVDFYAHVDCRQDS